MVKYFSKIWIIGILAVVLAGGFFAWQYWAPKLAPADETADWKTYRNEEYGFEVKYPSYLSIKEEMPFSQTVSFEKTLRIEFFSNLKSISGNENHVSLEQWLLEMASVYKGTVEPVFFGVNKYKGFLFKYPKEPGPQSFIVGLYVQHNDAIYMLSDSDEREFSELTNQMLSTFRFLE